MPDNEAPMVSHGRGGSASRHHTARETSAMTPPSKSPDSPHQRNLTSPRYVDGEIVREGAYGDQGDGAYSAGRGGAGNIGSPMVRPTSKVPHDVEMIPELAVRNSTDETYHVGRGGQGNVHLDEATLKEKEEQKKKKNHEGLADKLKNKLLGRK
ncbi:unnamed protein product [Penicillium bialowiezense]